MVTKPGLTMISTRLKKALAEKISTFCKHCVGDKLPFGQVQLPGYEAVAPGSCLVVGLCCARLSLSCSLRSAPLYCQHWKAAAATFCVQVPILNLSNASVFARGVATSRKCILRYGHYTHFHTRGAAASIQQTNGQPGNISAGARYKHNSIPRLPIDILQSSRVNLLGTN